MFTEFRQGQGGGSVYAGTWRVTVSHSVRATRERLTEQDDDTAYCQKHTGSAYCSP